LGEDGAYGEGFVDLKVWDEFDEEGGEGEDKAGRRINESDERSLRHNTTENILLWATRSIQQRQRPSLNR
jgi:hypothetical protein